MTTPKSPWYQFSLRSLLLFAAFVAVLCSIGVCTYWAISFAVLIGLPLGVKVARAKEGVFVCGSQFFMIALVGCGCVSTTTVGGQWGIGWWWAIGWWLTIVIAVLMGCVYGRLMTDASKARRRWLKIIPIALLSVMFLEGIYVMWNGTRQREIRAAITKLGGSVGTCHWSRFSYRGDLFGNLVRVERAQFTDADLEQLKNVLQDVPQLEELHLSDTQVTDAGLDRLKCLARLKCLDLRNTQVTDAGVKKLQQALPNCQILR